MADPLPVCDHYCGVEERMRKSLALQSEMAQEWGTCVFDVTLDCEDGAPVGGESDHANMVVALANQAQATIKKVAPRIAARVHPVGHVCFEQDVEIIVGGAASALCHVMIPKVESVADVDFAAERIDHWAAQSSRLNPLPLHVLIESPAAVFRALEIAAHPRVQSLSFGLMDFVSAHGGAIPASAMGFQPEASGQALDQFSHPLVVRAKLEIAAACHAHGKVPSHCVVTEFGDASAIKNAARQASRALGYTRMWSIHPAQIRPILDAFSPSQLEIQEAASIILHASQVDWAPISSSGKLHDRASYRYFWQVLERAHRTGRPMPNDVQEFFVEAHGLTDKGT